MIPCWRGTWPAPFHDKDRESRAALIFWDGYSKIAAKINIYSGYVRLGQLDRASSHP
jgi:hypothetical protein